jgi:Ca-activated chloride channel family protein
MGAEDVDGSRIERAREVVEILSDGLPSARIVLILFADWPYTLVPPTDDPAVVRYFAHSLSADLVLDRDQGTSFTTALAHAQASLELRPRAEARRAVLVLSDGGAHEEVGDVIDAAATLSGEDVPVWTAGLGTPEGSAVPTATGPLVDPSGRPVIARLENDMLREIARAGGGEYHNVSEDRGVEALLEGLGAVGADEQGGSDVPPDATFWLALATIPLILLEGAADAGRFLSRANTQTRSA